MGTVERRNNRLVFRYASKWQSSGGAFPLSASMPLVQGEHPHSKIEPYLWNLLPDNGTVLEEWGKRFHVSHNNVFSLLEHVGEDCAGAIQFIPEAREAELLDQNHEEEVEWIADADLAKRIEDASHRSRSTANRHGCRSVQPGGSSTQNRTLPVPANRQVGDSRRSDTDNPYSQTRVQRFSGLCGERTLLPNPHLPTRDQKRQLLGSSLWRCSGDLRETLRPYFQR